MKRKEWRRPSYHRFRGEYDSYNNKVKEENTETLDIFEPAMYNLFDTGSIVIDSILDRTIGK